MKQKSNDKVSQYNMEIIIIKGEIALWQLFEGSEYSGTLDSLYDGGDQVVNVIAAALNGVTSLFNNSCDVNTVKFHQVFALIFSAQKIDWACLAVLPFLPVPGVILTWYL